ncbi:LysR family transcriptional regulator [Salmonella enterica]|nr:LysR family transcriptional regulator [Salmonella enterica]EDS4734249.1 LysR family transcriptional regulator [Salmonella enterica subsp. enterica serovar Oranienburg]EGX8050472.1 LysR family transcriptional regulator [Salmonella enterica subsp. enterica serovar Inganda]EEH2567618.1 LysR family transcriptional regulator [Salmonella enterica]EGX8054897.1 LysR family transcriptional regulator [Salmonella enterica subsp. enterica serovar Inganda]
MDYALLETFVVVSETLNFTRASEILYRTQPTITNRVRTLENQLGFDLLSRNKGKRTIELTERGEEFLVIAKQLLAFYNKIDDMQKNIARNLNIGAIDSIGTTIIADVSRVFGEQTDDVSISIKTYQTREAYELIRKRELDIAFVSQPFEHPNVTCEAIFKQDLCVIKPGATKSEICLIKPADLNIRDEIYHSWGEEYDKWHESIWGGTSKPAVRVDSCALLARFMKEERHWAIVQSGNIPTLSHYFPFQILQLDIPTPQRACYMITNSYPERSVLPLIKKFQKLLGEYITTGGNEYFLPIGVT